MASSNLQLKHLVEYPLDDKVIGIKKLYGGYNSLVYGIKTKRLGDIVLKIPYNPNKLKKEASLLRELSKHNIPVPKVLYLGNNYLIEERLQGIRGSEYKFVKAQKNAFYFELGKILKRIHAIKTSGFGEFISKNVGEYSCWKEYLDKLFYHNVEIIKARRLYDTDLLRHSISFYEDKLHLLQQTS